MEAKKSVILCAKNEEHNIERTLKMTLKGIQDGTIDYVSLVLDGPEDATRDIAQGILGITDDSLDPSFGETRYARKGNVVVSGIPDSMGLGSAFSAGVNRLNSQTDLFDSDDSIITRVDVDQLEDDPASVVHLMWELENSKVPMLLGQHYEGEDGDFGLAEEYATGFRAMRASALRPVVALDTPEEWSRVFPAGFGMDAALNLLICSRDAKDQLAIHPYDFPSMFNYRAKAALHHGPPGRHQHDLAQDQHRLAVLDRFKDPTTFYRELHQLAPEERFRLQAIREIGLAFPRAVFEQLELREECGAFDGIDTRTIQVLWQ